MECIDPRALAERVEQLTGPVFVSPSEADMSIEGHIERRPKGGLRARIAVTRSTGAQAGDRELEFAGTNCRDFDDTLTFVIALTIDPDLDLESVQRALGPMDTEPEQALLQELEATSRSAAHAEDPLATSTGLDPEAPKPLPAVPQPETPAKRNPRFRVGGSVFIAGRELPRTSLGAALGFAWLAREFLSVSWWTRSAPALGELALQGDRSLRALALSTSLLVCPRIVRVERLVLTLCVGPEIGLQRARGVGLNETKTAWLSTYGGLVRLDSSLHLGTNWSLELQGFLTLNAADKRFVYDIPGQTLEAYRIAQWGSGAALGVNRAF